jgi:hypothetical protein
MNVGFRPVAAILILLWHLTLTPFICDWHGGLPPISLRAFIFFAVGYIFNLLGRE